MWFMAWWEALNDPHDPLLRRLRITFVVAVLAALGWFVVWPFYQVRMWTYELHQNPTSSKGGVAAWELGQLGPTARSAVKTLITVLDSSDLAPAFAPDQGETPPPVGTEAVFRLSSVPVEAAKALRKIGDPKTSAALLQRMRDCRESPHGTGAGAARMYLRLCDGADPRLGPKGLPADQVEDILGVLTDSQNAMTCNILLNWLSARQLLKPESDPDGRVKQILLDCLGRLRTKAAATILVQWIDRDAEVLPVIVEEERRQYLDDPEKYEPSAVFTKSIHSSNRLAIEPALPLLIAELDRDAAEMAIQVINEAFAYLVRDDLRTLRDPPLSQLFWNKLRTGLDDSRPAVRSGLLETLTRIAVRHADDPVVIGWYDTDVQSQLTNFVLHDESELVRLRAAIALWKVTRRADPGAEVVFASLSSEDEATQAIANAFIAELGPQDAWGVEVFAARLTADTSRSRTAALRALAQLGPPAHAQLATVVKLLDSSDPETVKAAVDCLAAFGPAAKPAIPRLWEFITAENFDLRRQVLDAMAKIEPDERKRKKLEEE